MTCLLDTHTLLWWILGDSRLPVSMRTHIMRSPHVYVSAASVWEITTKVRIGKLPLAINIVADFLGILEHQGFISLPVTTVHAHLAGSIESEHRDPFDRMLAAQSIIENMPVITRDPNIKNLGASVMW